MCGSFMIRTRAFFETLLHKEVRAQRAQPAAHGQRRAEAEAGVEKVLRSMPIKILMIPMYRVIIAH